MRRLYQVGAGAGNAGGGRGGLACGNHGGRHTRADVHGGRATPEARRTFHAPILTPFANHQSFRWIISQRRDRGDGDDAADVFAPLPQFPPLKDREAAFGAHTAAREKCHGRNALHSKSICTKFLCRKVDTAHLAGVFSCSSPTHPAGDVRLE